MNGKRVHVGANSDAAPAASLGERPHHASAGHTRRHLKAEPLKLIRNDLRRPEFLEAKLGMHVKVMPDGGEFASES
jgi:hypothetical protein